jgi:Tol biopolymer transport system component
VPQAPGFSRLGMSLRRAVGGSVLISLLMGGTAGFAAGTLELVSRVAPSQVSGTGAGSRGGIGPDFLAPLPRALSNDGRYAVFLSSETNLASGQRDANQAPDVFLHDLLTGTTTLVSHVPGSPDTAGNGRSDAAAISGDGRWIAYTSQATNLAAGQPGPPFSSDRKAILLYDRAADASTLVADSSFASFQSPAISGDGRYVAFASSAMDLVPGQQGVSGLAVFLYDQAAKSFQLVSHASASPTSPGNGPATRPVISADGRYVAFLSSATDLVPGQPAGDAVFLYDRLSGAVTLVGPGQEVVMSADGRYLAVKGLQSTYLYDAATQTQTLLASTNPSASAIAPPALAISPDGRYVALVSLSTHVVPPQPGGTSAQGVYLYDRLFGTFTLASRRQGSATTAGLSAAAPALSADGRYVAFLSQDTDLVAGQTDANRTWDLFLFDRNSGAVTLVSRAAAAATTTADDFSYTPAMSADGARLVFYSLADNLAAGVLDRNNFGEDVFVYSTASATLAAVTRHAPDLPSIVPEAWSQASAVSGDGRWAAFESFASHLIDGQADTNDKRDVFLYDRATRATILVSHAAGTLTRTAHGGSFAPKITPDGRWVLFVSDATDLVAGTTLPGSDDNFFLFDRLTGKTVLADRTRGHGSENLPFFIASISQDGRWVVFPSNAPDLVPGQQDPYDAFDIFLWDRVTGGTTLVTHSTAGPTVTGDFDSTQPLISDDGRWVAFVSGAPHLVPGQIEAGFGPNIFLWDRTTGKTVLVSHAQGSPLITTGVDPFTTFSLSADGRFIAFQSLGGIEPGVPGGLYLFDRTSPVLVRIAGGLNPALSADGHYVAFLSVDVPGVDTRGQVQVFLYDRIARTTTLVSRSLSGSSRGGEEDAYDPAISADGRYVAFDSQAADLAPGQPTPGPFDPTPGSSVFLWDRLAGTAAWISVPPPGAAQTSGHSSSPLLSASGRQVAFTSSAGLVAGDFNDDPDAYLFSLDPPPPPTGGPVPVPPCALFTGPLRSNARKVLKVAGSCGVPPGAKQVAVKLTVSQGTGKGNVQLYQGNVRTPSAGILRFERGATRAANFTLPLSTNGTGTIALLPFVAGNGTVRVAVEVDGYTP